jgi:hypothetical protein
MTGRMRMAATSSVTFLVKTALVPRNVSSTRRIQEALRYHRTRLSNMEARLSERALVRADLLEGEKGQDSGKRSIATVLPFLILEVFKTIQEVLSEQRSAVRRGRPGRGDRQSSDTATGDIQPRWHPHLLCTRAQTRSGACVKDYFLGGGISASRRRTASYGEEDPSMPTRTKTRGGPAGN